MTGLLRQHKMHYRPAYHYIILLILALSATIEGVCQQVNIGTPPMRNYTKKNYRAGTQNWDATQDSHGVLYWANNDGLLRFDGTNWSCYPVPNQTIVRSVAIDLANRVYVGAQSEFGYFSPSPNGSLAFTSLIRLLPEGQRTFEDVWDIVLHGEDVFFRTNEIVFQYTNGQIKVHPQEGELLALFTTPLGLMLQKNAADILIFRDGQFKPFLKIPELKSAITGSLSWQGDTHLLSSLKEGLFFLKGNKAARWTTTFDNMLQESRIYSSTNLPNGNLALGTSLDGLLVIDQNRKVYRHLNKKSGLQNNNILNTFCDRAGNVWLGLDNGIDCIVLDSPFSSIFPDGEMQATGYSAAVHNGLLYLGVSNGAYVAPWQAYYDPAKEPVFKKVKGAEGQVWGLHAVGDELLMGHHEGAFALAGETARRLSAEPGAWAFVQLSDNYCLGGTYSGLILFKREGGTWMPDRKLEGLKESCRIMVRDEDGAVWVSHPYRGLYRIEWSEEHKYDLNIRFFNQENGLPTNLNNYVFEVAGKAVFTTEKGVFHFDPAKDQFVPAEDFNRLLGSTNRVKYLKEDSKGNVWYVTNQETGMLTVNDFGLKKEVRKTVFPELNGRLVGGFEFLYPIDEQNVIVGTEQGFIHYAVEHVQSGDTLLQVTLNSVTAGGSADSILFGGYYKGDTFQPPGSFPILEAGMNNLGFSFSATEYKNPGLIEYRTQLEGLNENWSTWSAETKRNYTNLGPGKYTFRVQARLKGTQVSKAMSYTFRIYPPWYKSPLALGVYGLSFIGLFAGFIMRQHQKFETEKAYMTETHQKKEAAHIIAVAKSKAAVTEIQHEKLEAEITYKNQELALTTMHLVQKAEILLTVQENLNHIMEKSPNPTVKKEIQQLLNLLNFDVKLDEDWAHFAHHFDQVHVNFLKDLRDQFPQLSANDYRLCAYLRMNLSTKEIAPLMNISVRGVEGSRYRLRRKLNLPNDANLTEFILGVTPNTSSPKAIEATP